MYALASKGICSRVSTLASRGFCNGFLSLEVVPWISTALQASRLVTRMLLMGGSYWVCESGCPGGMGPSQTAST